MDEVAKISFSEKTVKNYDLLGKEIIDYYDMEKTKKNVLMFIAEYKKSKFKYFTACRNLNNITANYGDVYYNSNNSHDKLGHNVALKIDGEALVVFYELTINKLYDEMSPTEQIYYTYVLSNNRSEQTVLDLLNMSKSGLKPYKDSCILKIALAFDKAVSK